MESCLENKMCIRDRNLRGEGAVLSGNIELHKTTYVKKEVGEYYDYINKITVKRYEYDPVTTLVQEISFKTDANGRFTTPDIAYPQEENSYYEAIVSFTSPQAGNPKIRESVYIGSHYYPNDEQEDYYTLQPENYEAKNTVENGVTPLYLNNQGEQVENKGQVLCITAQDKMLALELLSLIHI